MRKVRWNRYYGLSWWHTANQWGWTTASEALMLDLGHLRIKMLPPVMAGVFFTLGLIVGVLLK